MKTKIISLRSSKKLHLMSNNDVKRNCAIIYFVDTHPDLIKRIAEGKRFWFKSYDSVDQITALTALAEGGHKDYIRQYFEEKKHVFAESYIEPPNYEEQQINPRKQVTYPKAGGELRKRLEYVTTTTETPNITNQPLPELKEKEEDIHLLKENILALIK